MLVGPGEGAGVVDVGDGIAVALRIESHNHPSAVEPYQGAATGVGGHPPRHLLHGRPSDRPDGPAALRPARRPPQPVGRRRRRVAASRGYGNSVGVPTVGGEVVFDETLPRQPAGQRARASASCPSSGSCSAGRPGVGNLAVLLGSSTGRDGIGGVSVLASAGFATTRPTTAKRPCVQVGDPFEEKRLIEACLELLDAGLVVGVQDLGGGRHHVRHVARPRPRAASGMDVDVAAMPAARAGHGAVRGDDAASSQERMLAIVDARASSTRCWRSAPRWEVRATVIGTRHRHAVALRVLSTRRRPAPRCSPTCRRQVARATTPPPVRPAGRTDRPPTSPPRSSRRPGRPVDGPDATAELRCRAAAPRSPTVVGVVASTTTSCSSTRGRPGRRRRRAAAEAPGHGRRHRPRLALTTDGNPRWCALDPRTGAAAGRGRGGAATSPASAPGPIALVNCLNFGNPEHPEVMWQFSEVVDGMSEACRALGIPVIGGNVSFYNESRGRRHRPDPVVGVLGSIDDLRRRPPGLGLVTARTWCCSAPIPAADGRNGYTFRLSRLDGWRGATGCEVGRVGRRRRGACQVGRPGAGLAVDGLVRASRRLGWRAGRGAR